MIEGPQYSTTYFVLVDKTTGVCMIDCIGLGCADATQVRMHLWTNYPTSLGRGLRSFPCWNTPTTRCRGLVSGLMKTHIGSTFDNSSHGESMGKVIIEFDEDDLERLFETQTSILEVMLRIETLLKEKAKDDTRSKSKTSRNKAS